MSARPVMVPAEVIQNQNQNQNSPPPPSQKTQQEEIPGMYWQDKVNLNLMFILLGLYTVILVLATCFIHGWCTTPNYSKLKALGHEGSTIAQMAKLCPDSTIDEYNDACDALRKKLTPDASHLSRVSVPTYNAPEQLSQGSQQ